MTPLFVDYFRLNTHGLLNIGIGLFNLMVGGLILSAQPKAALNRTFFLISVVAFQWMIGWGMFSSTRAPDYFWASYSFSFGVPLIAPSVFLFSTAWRRGKIFSTGGIIALIGGILLMLPALFWPQAVFVAKDFSWGRYVRLTPTWFGKAYATLLLSHFVIVTFSAFLNFFFAYRDAATPIEKSQTRLIIIAFSVAYLGAYDFLVWLGRASYAPGYIFLSGLLSVIAYIIFRFRTFNIDFALRRLSLIAFVYTFLFAVLVPLSVPLLRAVADDLRPNQIITLVLTMGAYTAVLSMGPLIYVWLARRGFWLKLNTTTGLTHELKSPIAVIQGSLEVLNMQIEKGQPDTQMIATHLSTIQRCTDRLSAFVANLLDIAKIQENQVALHRTPFDLADVIRNEAALIPTSDTRRIEPRVCPSMVYADLEKMRQVVSNLISNALKFTKEGIIRLELERNGGEVWCRVKDTGCGIVKSDLERIFDRFYHGRHSNRGAGIGLAIAKAWVEAHGGRIWAESEGEGRGVTVTFTLPAI